MDYYFIGIKGSGMSALANILVDLGYKVKGVDYEKKHYTDEISKRVLVENFDDVKLDKDSFYIIGNAFKLHSLTQKIISERYNYDYYPNFIESFFKMNKIGISGSHGKTTTTSFLHQILKDKANALIGDGTGYGYPHANNFLFEACEYQNTFLKYTFDYLVVLNIDYDHPDFFKTNNEYIFAFQKASLNAKILIINNDCPHCRKIIHSNKITFGTSKDSDVIFKLENDKIHIDLFGETLTLDYVFYNKTLAYNLVAAVIVKYLITGDVSDLFTKVNELSFPKRRFEEFKLRNDLIFICDYAHHPTEIKVVIETLRTKYPAFKLIVVYQGHTYTRTHTFLSEYKHVLNEADEVYVMPIFSSVREEDFDSNILLKNDNGFRKYERAILDSFLSEKDTIVAFLGAGDIDSEFIFLLKKVNY